MLEMSFNQEQYLQQFSQKLELTETIEQLILYGFSLENYDENRQYEVDITFTDNKEIHELNKNFRNVDRPTDVISFALSDYSDDILYQEIPEIPVLLGEIFISVEQALIQAEAYGHTAEREICFLAIHGFLHLLGYDHMTEEDEKIMVKKQETILEHFQIKR